MKVTGRKKSSIKHRLFFPIMFIILFQAVVFFSVLALSGEFKYVSKYAYENLIEKTTNRKNYIESEMNQRWSAIYDTAEEIQNKIQNELDSNNADISDIKKDKSLNLKIMRSVFDDIVYMMKKNSVNDAFIILESGDLYNSEEISAKSCLYLRDTDVSEASGKNSSDILMKIGYSELAYENDITFDMGWSLNFEMSDSDKDYSFFTETIKTAEENPDLSLKSLGHWTGFSSISDLSLPSIKYTLPLTADDGTVYGVIGIGVTEATILKKIPSNDILNESAVYMLTTRNTSKKHYDVQVHSGSAYSKIIGNKDVLIEDKPVSDSIATFNQSNNLDIVGTIQRMRIYNSDSPYTDEEWSLISAAENKKILKIYTNFVNMLVLSLLCSVAAGVIVAIIASRQISKPITDISAYLDNTAPEQHLDFKSTGITEIDILTDAIEELRVSIEESASRVSEIIKLVDIGVGVFMYDRIKQTMFVSEDCIKMLEFNGYKNGDANMSISEFMEHLKKLDYQNTLFYGKNDEIFQISGRMLKMKNYEEHIKWMKFSIAMDDRKVLGAVQDVTRETIEKKRIEYERDYDLTTGLLNRRAYYQKVAERFRNKSELKVSAFLMVDLDNLKYVNDTYGHDFGDDYIKTAANVLKKFNEYNALVSRLSGDEFNVFLSGYNSKYEIRQIISRIRKELLNSYCLLLDGSHYNIRASAGISWYPDNSESYEQLMKYADFAMYTIKNNIKGGIAEFDMEAYEKDSILITGIEEMNRIIDGGCVKYAFHSIVDARTGELFGYKALMRPQSDILKSPLELIRLAKTGSKLDDVEKLTWKCSLLNFREQIEIGNIKPDSKIFINSIANCTFEDEYAEMIESEYGDVLKNVVMEINRTDDECLKKKKESVEKWNAMLALDDFGISNNEHITSDFNIVMIDRSVISGCDNDESRQNIIRNVVKSAKQKNILVLAEGIETYQQMKLVISYGVDLLQGYYINRPVFEPAELPQKITDEIKELNSD